MARKARWCRSGSRRAKSLAAVYSLFAMTHHYSAAAYSRSMAALTASRPLSGAARANPPHIVTPRRARRANSPSRRRCAWVTLIVSRVSRSSSNRLMVMTVSHHEVTLNRRAAGWRPASGNWLSVAWSPRRRDPQISGLGTIQGGTGAVRQAYGLRRRHAHQPAQQYHQSRRPRTRGRPHARSRRRAAPLQARIIQGAADHRAGRVGQDGVAQVGTGQVGLEQRCARTLRAGTPAGPRPWWRPAAAPRPNGAPSRRGLWRRDSALPGEAILAPGVGRSAHRAGRPRRAPGRRRRAQAARMRERRTQPPSGGDSRVRVPNACQPAFPPDAIRAPIAGRRDGIERLHCGEHRAGSAGSRISLSEQS